MNIELIGDNVLIEELKEEDITKGGIVIPDTVIMKPVKGKVVAVGIGRLLPKTGTRLTPQVKVGDIVLYGKQKISEVEYKGRKYIVIPEEFILGIIKGE